MRLEAHERVLARILEALTALCIVAALLALARGQAGWTILFGAASFACFETSSELGS